MTDLHPNEIRDYVQRAPKKWHFDGCRMVNNTYARLRWLAEIAHGTIHERINRRAGAVQRWRPFCDPVYKAVLRNKRRILRRAGLQPMF